MDYCYSLYASFLELPCLILLVDAYVVLMSQVLVLNTLLVVVVVVDCRVDHVGCCLDLVHDLPQKKLIDERNDEDSEIVVEVVKLQVVEGLLIWV